MSMHLLQIRPVLFNAKRQSEGDLQNCQHEHVVYARSVCTIARKGE